MDIEFHYYITHIIARRAGFTKKDAYLIAYSSQYVDDNDIAFTVNKGQPEQYSNFISQTMNILEPKKKLLKIYPAFHFIPGDPSGETTRRRDGKQHILNTTPDNPIAQQMLQNAFKADESIRMYQIGIATHAFADTWAHQNFIGWYDDFNAVGEIRIPIIGHADAKHDPDYPAHLWKDKRLIPGKTHINNIDRFMSAGARLYEEYRGYLGEAASDNGWEQLETDLVNAIGIIHPDGEKKADRVDRYQATANIEPYSESKWFDEAIRTKVRGLKDSTEGLTKEYLTFFRDQYFWRDASSFRNTNWYRFQQAVKQHENEALELLSPVFAKMAINIRDT